MKYIALKDMPFWEKGKVYETDVISYSTAELTQMIKDGWITELRLYTIEEIEKAWEIIFAHPFVSSDFKRILEELK